MGNTSSSHSTRGTATPNPDTPSRSASRRSRSQHLQNHRDAPPPPSSANHSPARAGDAHQPVDDKSQTSQKRLPHRSLRTKKKSLELPDLALALTPPVSAGPAGSGISGPYRRPQASSPIAIPSRSSQNGAVLSDSPRLKTIPTAQETVNGHLPPMAEVFVQPADGRGRGHSHMRGGPLPYNSTRSFTGTARGQPLPSFVLRAQAANVFSPEDIHSSIPLALRKAEPSGASEEIEREEVAAIHDTKRDSTEGKQPAQVCIVWRGGGRSVFLVRAGDNNWKGRQAMDYDEAKSQWAAWVPLLPGTHHIRFLVDGVSTIAEDLPTTVDDNGSLANYVAVPFSATTTPSTSVQATPREQTAPPTTGTGQSFFADAEAHGGQEDGDWTDKVPWQLECAAEEEEQWLNHSHSHTHSQHQVPPPQHPQAPSLPRHLEKLIMNQKPPTTRTSSKHSASSTALFGDRGSLPVTTASGTNLSATSSGANTPSATVRGSGKALSGRDGLTKLGDAPAGVHAGPGLADDGSVLPVPSHVVLHHLGTSAIRNGVLAVADTVRYRKKYITTIYYKPT